MAAPILDSKQQKKALSGSKKQRPSLRSVLCTPYNIEWPKLDPAFEQKLYDKLTAVLGNHDLKKPVINKHLKKAERQASMKALLDAKPEVDKNLRSQLVCGVNATTKAVERGKLCLVLVDRASMTLTKHLIQLCAVRQCMAIALRDLAKKIAPLLSMTQLSCVGFRSVTPEDDQSFCDVVEFVKSDAPKVELPWLNFEKSLAEDISAYSEGEQSGSESEKAKCETSELTKESIKNLFEYSVSDTKKVEENENKSNKSDFISLEASSSSVGATQQIKGTISKLNENDRNLNKLLKTEYSCDDNNKSSKAEKSRGLDDFISLGGDSESCESDSDLKMIEVQSSGKMNVAARYVKYSAKRSTDGCSAVGFVEPLGFELVPNKKRKGEERKDKFKDKKRRKVQDVKKVKYESISLHKLQPNPNKKKKKKKKKQNK